MVNGSERPIVGRYWSSVLILSPPQPQICSRSAFLVTICPADEVNEISLMGRLFESLTKQINDSLKLSDVKAEFSERFKSLESRILVDNERLVELDKLKKEMNEIRNQLWQRKSLIPTQTSGSMDRLLPGYLRMNTDGIKIVKMDDMQPFEKYTLTQSTIEYLKKPTFDIWHWEPNEVSLIF
ncbi:hypothetical protein FBUS_02198 [Fasciolopsis buskii]|uniref:Uncharacterized protein n=1 Tax=Fasciolopsis buskii TaxID=27845 RepID=A0A8E0S4F4_9TREM|nr:hypothetical protein FBUS_02198 [Fasciolopsis buski]